MKIGQILKEKQPEEYNKLQSKQQGSNTKEHFSEKDILKLMGHSCYKRRNGAIRQIK